MCRVVIEFSISRAKYKGSVDNPSYSHAKSLRGGADISGDRIGRAAQLTGQTVDFLARE
jgi:hypothetical protein